MNIMTGKTTFSEGYIDGWSAIKGRGTIPAIPSNAIPAGKTPYDHGLAEGTKAANESEEYLRSKK